MRIISRNRLQRAAAKAMDRWTSGRMEAEPAYARGDTPENRKADAEAGLVFDSTQLDQVFGQTDDELLRLARALRMERRLGQAGHWSYDLNRHIALMRSIQLERDKIRSSKRAQNNPVSGTD